MTSLGNRQWPGIVVAVLSLGLLITADASAQAIHVLLIHPREPSELSRQVTRLDEAIAASAGPLVPVSTLAEADAVVQFTGYQRLEGQDNGYGEDYWVGQFKLLTPPARKSLVPVAERFLLPLIGPGTSQARQAADLLARLLAQALGRKFLPTRDAPLAAEQADAADERGHCEPAMDARS